MNSKEVIGLLLRYVSLIVLAIGNLALFYKIFTPLTFYPVYYILSWLYDAKLLAGNVFFLKGYYAELIPACIAGAAYYFLLILNLTTPMELSKRIKTILFSIFIFWIINIARIIIFAALLAYGFQYFDLAHRLVWYFGSTLLVVVIWFSAVWLFEITNIPVYTDFKNLFTDIANREK